MSKYAIGIDIGATKIAAGLVNQTGKVERKIKIATAKKYSENIRNIIFLIDKIRDEKFYSIGIGMAGQIDVNKGKVIYSPNMPAWRNISLLKILSAKLKSKSKACPEPCLPTGRPCRRIKIDNDANCFTLAEWKLGYPKVKNLIGLTLGTGIGSGAIIDGKLYYGEAFAPEIGHTTIEAFGRRCSCGKRGHLEIYSSGRAIERQYFNLTKMRFSATEIEKRAYLGDQKAKKVYHEAKEYLALGFSNIICDFDPAVIILGGSIGVKSKLIYSGLRELVKNNLFLKNKEIKIARARLGDDGGLIGAAMLVM
jgi:glucokinase